MFTGEAAQCKLSFSKGSKRVAMSFCVAGVACRDVPTCFKTCRKSFCVSGALLLHRFPKMMMKFFNENRIVLTRGKDKSLSCAAFAFKGGEWWEVIK